MCLESPVNTCTHRTNPTAERGPDNTACFSAETKSEAPQQVSDKFLGMDWRDVLVVETCAGSARLTKAMRSTGMRSLAVDKSKGQSCGTEIMLLDLMVQQGLQAWLQNLQSEASRIALVFNFPTCGTASKARERPIKASQSFGRKQPEPLRAWDKPDQKDKLSGRDKVKTKMANQLYQLITTLVLECHKLGLWVLAENPRSNLYWSTGFAMRCITEITTFWINFHSCAPGRCRDKFAKLWSNKDRGSPLQRFCNKMQPHASCRPRVVDGKPSFQKRKKRHTLGGFVDVELVEGTTIPLQSLGQFARASASKASYNIPVLCF